MRIITGISFWLLLSPLAANAQNGSLTKAQTVQFIADYFAAPRKSCLVADTGMSTTRVELKAYTVSFDYKTSLMTFSYLQETSRTVGEQTNTTIAREKVAIDFSATEAIWLRTAESGDCTLARIFFRATPGHTFSSSEYVAYEQGEGAPAFGAYTPQKEVGVVIAFYRCPGCDNRLVNNKIIQSFQHLRQLCGAPGPSQVDGN